MIFRGMLTELHLHFHGCVRAKVLLRHLAETDGEHWDWYESGMAAAFGAVPPTREIVERYRRGDESAEDAFEELFVFGDEDAGDFDRFQAKANLLWVTSGPSAAGKIAGFAAGIRADHRRQGVAHAELRVSADMMAALDGDDAERFAISLARSDPWHDWEIVQDLALGPRGRTVTGIDFGGREEGHPPKAKAEFFAAVREFNAEHPDRALAILYHVGESFRDKSLESAVRWVQEAAELGAHRLGHAIALGVDPAFFGTHSRSESVDERRDQIAYDLRHAAGLRAAGVPVEVASLHEELARLPREGTVVVGYDHARLDEVRRRQGYAIERVRATGAVVEVCPTSNRRIGGLVDPAHHPVHRFLSAGLPIVVSSDDPGIFGTTLAAELDWVCEHTGGGADLRRALLDTAWRSRSEVLTGRIGAQKGLSRR
ncbi:hypothetical protein [Amycolatopsis sp. CA-230715]|uniref:hypothetical protein n=1 Tax=Amycolatopsis sp. CA-230715 TaxID=2745196 RepID=UPI001C0368AC|nr:hypothetical protein [Amycolatopsis sp. CA-230715]QWF83756.1 Adenosine deaminase [Amycolatopsis sp. CA-230715]